MSSFGSQLRKRLAELHKIGADVPNIMAAAAEGATIEAVRVAQDNTPPNNAPIKGVNTRSGEMAQSWQTDSITTPKRVAGGVQTELNNNMQYASYVNDGHRVDEHFTSHVAIEGGVLVGKPHGDGGLVVGTKTTFVRGLYMKEKAKGRYRTVLRKELDMRIKEAFK